METNYMGTRSDVIFDRGGHVVVTVLSLSNKTDVLARIVAAVNACARIPTETLEGRVFGLYADCQYKDWYPDGSVKTGQGYWLQEPEPILRVSREFKLNPPPTGFVGDEDPDHAE